MKKIIVCAMAVLIGSWALAAQEVNLGFGITASPETNVLRGSLGGITGKNTYQNSFLAVKAILDVKYIEASIGVAFWTGGTYEDSNFLYLGTTKEDTHYDWAYIPISVMFKYPFEMGPSVRFFPAVGVEYDVNTSYNDNDLGIGKNDLTPDERDDLNHFYLKVGAGVDIALGGNVFLRPEILFAYKLLSTKDKDQIYYYQSQGYTNVSLDTYKLDLGLSLMFQL